METETSLIQLQKEFSSMKQEIKKIKKRVDRPMLEFVFVERVNENELTPARRKHMNNIDVDVKAGRTKRFLTLEEFAKSIEKRNAHPLE